MKAWGWIEGRRLSAAWLALIAATSMPAAAQVSSQGRGFVTFMIGQGSGPVGGVAANIVAGANVAPETRSTATAYRVGGGYQFGDYLGTELAVTHIGTLRSRAPFGTSDTLVAGLEFAAIEVDIVGRIPLAANFRVDLSAGAAATGLKTSLATTHGSALPPEPATLNARRAGPTVGADVEWRLGESMSLIAGWHLYSHVGSSSIVGLASGSMTLIAAGVHIEF